MYQQFAFTFPDDLDSKNVANIQVYNGFILTLPFRLRTGNFFSVQVGNSFDVIFRNCLDIPCGTTPDEVHRLMWEGKKFRPREQFFTEALVIDRNAAVTTDFRKQFIAFMEGGGDQKMPGSKARYFQAITSLNDAVVGYHHATNSLFGGTVVERLTTPTFFERLRYLHTIVCPSGYELSQTDLVEILDARGERQFTQMEGQFATSQLDDVPAEQLARIQQYNNTTNSINNFYFINSRLTRSRRWLSRILLLRFCLLWSPWKACIRLYYKYTLTAEWQHQSPMLLPVPNK